MNHRVFNPDDMPTSLPPVEADAALGAAPASAARHYATVARAITWLRQHYDRQPTLAELAAAVHLSPFHLQRVFAEWAGISPKRFLQVLTRDHALARLRARAGLAEVADEVGLGSTSRLFDLMISCEALTPGEIRQQGAGLTIVFGFADSPFGTVLAGWTNRGLCHFVFCDDAGAAAHVDVDAGPDATVGQVGQLAALWPAAHLQRDDMAAAALLAQIFPATPQRGRLHLVLRGTNFQVKVWQALLRTAPGDTLSYAALARAAGSPGAQRAVGSALAANAVGLLIPCHRVIRESGEVGQYRWGVERKLAMLAWEAARGDAAAGTREPATAGP